MSLGRALTRPRGGRPLARARQNVSADRSPRSRFSALVRADYRGRPLPGVSPDRVCSNCPLGPIANGSAVQPGSNTMNEALRLHRAAHDAPSHVSRGCARRAAATAIASSSMKVLPPLPGPDDVVREARVIVGTVELYGGRNDGWSSRSMRPPTPLLLFCAGYGANGSRRLLPGARDRVRDGNPTEAKGLAALGREVPMTARTSFGRKAASTTPAWLDKWLAACPDLASSSVRTR